MTKAKTQKDKDKKTRPNIIPIKMISYRIFSVYQKIQRLYI